MTPAEFEVAEDEARSDGTLTTQEKADIVTTLEALCVARERFGAMAMKTFMDDCDVVLKGKS